MSPLKATRIPAANVNNVVRNGGAKLKLATQKGFLQVNEDFETSIPGVYAGGDCIRSHGSCSIVTAVQDGKLAAAAISRKLSQTGNREATA